MSRYLTGTLGEAIEAAITQAAEEHAGEAIVQGAVAPWGDGETLPDVEDLMRVLAPEYRLARWTGEQDNGALRQSCGFCYDRFFRAEIDRLGAL